jgi:hypothetical protein
MYENRLLAYFQKMKVGLSNHQPVCVCCVSFYLCPPLITFETISGSSWNLVGTYWHSRWPPRHIFNPVASTISKWRTFKFLCWAQLLNRLVDLDKILYGGDDLEGDLESTLLNLVTSTIPNGGRLTFWGGSNFWTDWWIWMILKTTLIPY